MDLGASSQLDLDRDRSAIEAESDEIGTMAGLVVPLVVPPRDRVRPRVEREQLAAALELAGADSQPRGHPRDPAVVRPPGRSRLARRADRDTRDRHSDRVATNRQPSPRRIGYRASQPSRSSRRAWLLAATSLQPIAHRHASNGAGPNLDSHLSPAIFPQPGAIPESEVPLPGFEPGFPP